MAKTKKQSPSDPAEIARRKLPKGSEVNVHGLTLAANQDVVIEEATRDKVARVQRYDCFALLHARKSLSTHGFVAIRRFQADLAARTFTDDRDNSEKVEANRSSGSRELFTARSLDAAKRMDAVLLMLPQRTATLLVRLCQEPNNWRHTTQRVTGEYRKPQQVDVVVVACEGLNRAYVEIDKGDMRPARAVA